MDSIQKGAAAAAVGHRSGKLNHGHLFHVPEPRIFIFQIRLTPMQKIMIEPVRERFARAGSVKKENGEILTAGGRVLGVTATGSTLEQAIAAAYAAAKPISFQDMHFRTDIGKV